MLQVSSPSRTLLLKTIASIKLTAFISTSFALIQLFFIGSLVGISMKWHTTILKNGILQCFEKKQCHWVLLSMFPGSLGTAFILGFMAWPCYILFNNFDFFLESDPRKWLFRPLYHEEITMIQRKLVGWLCEGGYFGQTRSIAKIALNRRLPVELSDMILKECEKSIQAEREYFSSQLEFPRSNYKSSLERVRWNQWLQMLGTLAGGNRYTHRLPAQVVLSFQGSKTSDQQSTWLIVFSRDMALLSLGHIARIVIAILLSHLPMVKNGSTNN